MRTFLKRHVKEFNVFFCFLSNSILLKQEYVWTKYSLTKNCFYCANSAAENKFLIKFFNKSSAFWDLFCAIVSFTRVLLTGFFVELELIGLGFRVRKIISTVYRFFWGYATFIYFFVPKDILVEYSSEDRSIFFFGINAAAVNGFSTYLMLLKKLSTYRITGFIRPGKIIRLNSGKQR